MARLRAQGETSEVESRAAQLHRHQLALLSVVDPGLEVEGLGAGEMRRCLFGVADQFMELVFGLKTPVIRLFCFVFWKHAQG